MNCLAIALLIRKLHDCKAGPKWQGMPPLTSIGEKEGNFTLTHVRMVAGCSIFKIFKSTVC